MFPNIFFLIGLGYGHSFHGEYWLLWVFAGSGFGISNHVIRDATASKENFRDVPFRLHER